MPVHNGNKVHKTASHGNIGVSSPEESHLQALSEPGVNLSAHRAPIVPVGGTKPARQCGNKNFWLIPGVSQLMKARHNTVAAMVMLNGFNDPQSPSRVRGICFHYMYND